MPHENSIISAVKTCENYEPSVVRVDDRNVPELPDEQAPYPLFAAIDRDPLCVYVKMLPNESAQ
jgi:hypothetical protein